MGWTYVKEQAQLDSIVPILMSRRAWGFDTETTGLDPLVDKVTLMQFGDREDQFIIDTRRVNPEPLRPVLESTEIFKVLHNAKFDYKMVKANFGIEIERIRDTMLAAIILDMGRKLRGFSLAACLEDRLKIVVDKALQKSFINFHGDFTEAQLQYAADDVAHLLPLNKNYSDELFRDGLADTYALECAAVPCFGDMELAGLLLDKDKWNEIVKEHEIAANETSSQLDDIASSFYRTDLFGNVDVNYGSPKQMVEFLTKLGVKLTVTGKDGSEVEELLSSTSDNVLKQIKDVPAIKLLKKYRKHMKVVSTYGQPFINAIHPTTGLIHPTFSQIGAETGRITSAKDSPVNMLNIPRDKRMRNCFIAPEDFLIETDDYSGCELRIWAHLSQDQNLMRPLIAGDDLHCSVATALYGIPVIKGNENYHLRTPAKSLNFGRRW